MREHMGLYRGKRKYNGEWIEGNLLAPNYLCDDWCICPNLLLVAIEVDPDTVGECTGLRDENGKLAFEHDITEDRQGRRWVIFRCPGRFGICRIYEWTRNSQMIYNALADAQNAAWFRENHTIIGTILDNPELLKNDAPICRATCWPCANCVPGPCANRNGGECE